MQIVIDLDKKAYDTICNFSDNYIDFMFGIPEDKAILAIKNGTPLEISEDGTLCITVDDFFKVNRVLVHDDKHWGGLFYEDSGCQNAPTIIEAVEISKTYGLLTEPKLIDDYKTPTITVDISLESYESIMAIEEALNNGYTLCKVDEVVKKMNKMEDKGCDTGVTVGFSYVTDWLKEACK